MQFRVPDTNHRELLCLCLLFHIWSLSSMQSISSENVVSFQNTAQNSGCLPCLPTSGILQLPNALIWILPCLQWSCGWGLSAVTGFCLSNRRRTHFTLRSAQRTICYSDSEIKTDFPFYDTLAFPGKCSISYYFCRSAPEVALGENLCLNQ